MFRELHGAGNFQRVPDTDRGDLGMDGFSVDDLGHCYQCYATEATDVGARYEKQRDKITGDLRKLRRNATRIEELLGPVALHRWIFMVPLHDSKELIAHARKKEAEIKEAGLPFIADDFRVVIHTEKDYAKELKLIESHGLARIGALGDGTADQAVQELEREEPEQVKVMDEKLSRAVGDPARVRKLMLRAAVDGGNIRAYLHREHPLTDEQVTEQVDLEEQTVILERELGDLKKSSLLSVKERMTKRLLDQVTAVRESDSDRISYGVVAQWLMECPLDFPADQD
ncbi:MAG: hypothetical protein QM729_07390 [Solirubrobacterales bacterium]